MIWKAEPPVGDVPPTRAVTLISEPGGCRRIERAALAFRPSGKRQGLCASCPRFACDHRFSLTAFPPGPCPESLGLPGSGPMVLEGQPDLDGDHDPTYHQGQKDEGLHSLALLLERREKSRQSPEWSVRSGDFILWPPPCGTQQKVCKFNELARRNLPHHGMVFCPVRTCQLATPDATRASTCG